MGLWIERGDRVAKRLQRQIFMTPYSPPVIPSNHQFASKPANSVAKGAGAEEWLKWAC